MTEWVAAETSTHQDHVIAHVIDTTVLGYLVGDEALHILLDIGFIWTIYLDGQMVLLPQAVAISEMEVEPVEKARLKHEIEILERDGQTGEVFELLTPAPVECVIKEVAFFSSAEQRRLVLAGETTKLSVETSLETGRIQVSFSRTE
jgi:hypothetical protein